MLIRCITLMAIMSIMSVVLGCSGTTPAHDQSLLERNWGRSYESVLYMQMLDPDAGKNLDPVLGLDGNAASYNLDKYRETFKEKESKEIVNVLKLQ